MGKGPPGKLTKADATRHINKQAADAKLSLSWTLHAKERLRERGLILGDVLYVLRNGFVHDEPEVSTRDGYWKYVIESTTPNSDGRAVAVVVIPDRGHDMKVVTIMWRDER